MISREEVIRFLEHFEALAEREDFALVRDLVDEHAFFRFNDGDFAGRDAIQAAFEKTWIDFAGRDAIQAAFEKTWRGDPTTRKARFYLSDVVVLSTDERTATATYTYNWEGAQGEQRFTVRGRGTRVLVLRDGQLRIVHEHLSRFPSAG